MSRGITRSCLERARLCAEAAATNPDGLFLCIHRNQLDLLAPAPVGFAVGIEHAQTDVLVSAAIAAHVDLEKIGLIDADIRLALLGGNIRQNPGAVEVNPMSGEESLGFVAGIAGVAVEVEQNEFVGVSLLESREKVNVLERSARDFLIEDFALDSHQAVERLFPLRIGDTSARRHALDLPEEEHARIIVGKNPEIGQVTTIRHGNEPDQHDHSLRSRSP